MSELVQSRLITIVDVINKKADAVKGVARELSLKKGGDSFRETRCLETTERLLDTAYENLIKHIDG